jgi:hypothetical protein
MTVKQELYELASIVSDIYVRAMNNRNRMLCYARQEHVCNAICHRKRFKRTVDHFYVSEQPSGFRFYPN